MKNSRLVYSTETGRVRNACRNPQARSKPSGGDGVVRIRREVKGRRGKCVTTIAGIGLDDEALKQLAAGLKRLCGTGGSVKSGVVVIQGDHRTAIQKELQRAGFAVKLAGG